MEQQGCFLLDPTSTTEQQGVVNGPPLWQPAYLHPTPKTGNQLCLSLILFPHPSLKKKRLLSPFAFSPTLFVSLSLHLFLSLRSGISFSLSLGFYLKQEFFVVLFWVGFLWVGFILLSLLLFWHGACGIIVPRPEIELGPWAVKVQNLNHSITREFHKKLFLTSKMLGRVSLVAHW